MLMFIVVVVALLAASSSNCNWYSVPVTLLVKNMHFPIHFTWQERTMVLLPMVSGLCGHWQCTWTLLWPCETKCVGGTKTLLSQRRVLLWMDLHGFWREKELTSWLTHGHPVSVLVFLVLGTLSKYLLVHFLSKHSSGSLCQRIYLLS